ncbi:MAG: hypothetical protein ACE5KZ_11700 [Candidatus Scalinduaceae bacterium]
MKIRMILVYVTLTLLSFPSYAGPPLDNEKTQELYDKNQKGVTS